MTKPIVIIDAHWRRIDELFSETVWNTLNTQFEIVWGKDDPIPPALLESSLPDAFAFIAAEPHVSQETLASAPNLRLVVEVSGHFPNTIDYAACKERGVEVLSCAPGFQQSVAEMAVAMALAAGRGLVREHEAFRTGDEKWLDDCVDQDTTLFNASIGFVGYGSIARQVHRLIAAFNPTVSAYDPWLPAERASEAGITLTSLPDLMARSHYLFVTAAPTRDNYQMVNADLLARLPSGATLVLISRAHLVDFDALLAEAETGRIKAAIDVFPNEPVTEDHTVRHMASVVLSPHRAAAVDKGRQLIGDMVLDDLNSVAAGKDPARLNRASMLDVSALAGVGDAAAVEALANERT